jgi:hypothetical protein
MADRPDFSKMSVGDLRTLADNLSIENTTKLKKGELIAALELVAATSSSKPAVVAEVALTDNNATAEKAGESSQDASEKRGRRPRKTAEELQAEKVAAAAGDVVELIPAKTPVVQPKPFQRHREACLLYTSDAADEC